MPNFVVVEFEEGSGGGLALIREEWMTPRKKESFWPPFKRTAEYNKCLEQGLIPQDNWNVYGVKRIFYSCDDIHKARAKLREAESESDLQTTDVEQFITKRKKKHNRRYISDEDSDGDEDPRVSTDKLKNKLNLQDYLPLPPTTDYINTPADFSQPADKEKNIRHLTNEDVHTSAETHELGTPSTSFSEDRSSLNFSPTRYTSIDVVARHLAKIDKRLTDIEDTQRKILLHFPKTVATAHTINQTDLSAELKLPCNLPEDVENLDKWLSDKDENVKTLEHIMVLRGGKKIKHIVSRNLERLFTNELALQYNWTGKYNKKSLKQLKLIDVLIKAVRSNPSTCEASDLDIVTSVQNWFRFVKDRNGGRERRRQAAQKL